MALTSVLLFACNDVTLSGRVLLPDGTPAVGAGVYTSGSLVVHTDNDGRYTSTLDPTDDRLTWISVTAFHDDFGWVEADLDKRELVSGSDYTLPDLVLWDARVQVDGPTISWTAQADDSIYGAQVITNISPAGSMLVDAGSALSVVLDPRDVQDFFDFDLRLLATTPTSELLHYQTTHTSLTFEWNPVGEVPPSRGKLCALSAEPCVVDGDPFCSTFHECMFTDGRLAAWSGNGTIDMGGTVAVESISFTQVGDPSGGAPQPTYLVYAEVSDDLVNWSDFGSVAINTNRGLLLGAVIESPAPVQARYVRWQFNESGPMGAIGEVGVWTAAP